MQKPKILFLTNLKNSCREEDLFLINYIKEYFEIIVAHPLNCEKYEDEVNLILIRNIEPTSHYQKEFDKMRNRLLCKSIRVYPSLDSKGDINGKNYLAELYSKGFPIIPTVNYKKEIEKLGEVKNYFIKPIIGGDSFDCHKISKEKISDENLKGKIIQPFIDFEYEISFYYIDDKLQYSLYVPDKRKRWDQKMFKPTKKEILFAKRFVDWNNMKRGIQRIDVLKTKDGKLLLSEIEDIDPYLSLSEIDSDIRNKFLNNLVNSLKQLIKEERR